MNTMEFAGSTLQASLRMLGRLLLLAVCASLLSGCLGQGSDKRKLKIVTEPADATVVAGATASFTVAVNGGKTTYQWRRNGTAIVGATSATYTTPATVAGDNGALYSVVVTRGKQSLTSRDARLTVNVPPSITTQPANVTVAPGATATFSVTATGTAPLSYQWRRGGTNIAGATAATYTTPATVVGDSGAVFSVVVTNVAGSVTSGNATLTVTAPPTFSGTWGATKSIDNLDNQIRDPSMAIDRETGNAVTVWTQSPDGTHAGVYANVYDASSDTWSGPQLLNTAPLANNFEFIYAPKAAINSSGDIVVAWNQNTNQSTGTAGTVRAIRFKPGTGWSEVYLLTRIPGGPEPDIDWTYDVDLAMDFAGAATVVWTEQYDGLNTELVASARMPATGSFETAKLLEVAPDVRRSEYVRVVMDAAGNATAAWLRETPSGGKQVVTQRRPANASDWGSETLLVFLTSGGRLDYPALAVDAASGNVLLAWRQELPSDADYNIAYSTFVASSSTWRPNALAENGASVGGTVEVTVNDVGQGVIAWEEYGTSADIIRAARVDMATGALGTATTIATGSYSPAVDIDNAGNVMFLYNNGLVWARRMATDDSLGVATRLSETSVVTGIGGLGVADDGTAVAVWTQGFMTNFGSTYFTSNIYAKAFR